MKLIVNLLAGPLEFTLTRVYCIDMDLYTGAHMCLRQWRIQGGGPGDPGPPFFSVHSAAQARINFVRMHTILKMARSGGRIPPLLNFWTRHCKTSGLFLAGGVGIIVGERLIDYESAVRARLAQANIGDPVVVNTTVRAVNRLTRRCALVRLSNVL